MSYQTDPPDQLVPGLLRMAIQTELAFAELFNIIAQGAAARGNIAEQEWAANIADESTLAAVRDVIDLLQVDAPLDLEA